VFLQSLILRGFKSFADKTRLVFEPGITVVVGPNGSGKSNIVDALTWVLGTSSAKTLRGTSMADVVFAGSASRPALGRAAVEITIDNAAGTLPIEFSEVTVSRAMFASGENEYAINGVACRALDIQELLSDTGLGREHHTLVGQGQLDAVLNARPEERRILIDEATGILKHRRRKERALRKLAQVESHVERLQDVLRELRRSLRPLERQAEAASKHAELTRRLREVRLLRAGCELAGVVARYDAGEAAFAAARDRLIELEATAERIRTREAAIEVCLAELSPAARAAAELHFGLAGLLERYRGLAARIEERRRVLAETADADKPVRGRTAAELRAEAEAVRADLAACAARHVVAAEELETARAARVDAEQARRAHDAAVAAEARRQAEARERRLRWEGQVSALDAALLSAEAEHARLQARLATLSDHRGELRRELAAASAEAAEAAVRRDGLATALDAATAELADRRRIADDAVDHERELERRRAATHARLDALLRAAREEGEGAAALAEAAALGRVEGVRGPVSEHVEVIDGMACAITAALGPLTRAVVVASRRAAETAIAHARSNGSGRVHLLVSDAAVPRLSTDGVPSGDARPLVESLRGDPGVVAALSTALRGVYGVADFTTACRLADRYPEHAFVSLDGDIAGACAYEGGAATTTGPVVWRAQAAEARADLETIDDELEHARRSVAAAVREARSAALTAEEARTAVRDEKACARVAAERMRTLRGELAHATREHGLLSSQAEQLADELKGHRRRRDTLESPEGEPPDAPERGSAPGPDREAGPLDDLLASAREREVRARVALGGVEQLAAELTRRAQSFEDEAAAVERSLAEHDERRRRRLAALERCAALSVVAEVGVRQAESSLAAARADHDRLDEALAKRQRELGEARADLRAVGERLAGVQAETHRDDLARGQLRSALEGVRSRIRDHLDADPDDVLALLPADPPADAVLAEDEERLSRRLGLLGAVNPLAVEEHRALQERARFLEDQLDDLATSRRDLLAVVAAVDRRIQTVFEAAFRDVAAEFERCFSRLFPGGEARLMLTDPLNLVTTGVDVEARPAGKRLQSLSLLSGGERALTALAVLFAIFAARPSPFYVLDEVEAALDDVNLQRFLDVVRDFRDTSQLVLITHQQRTMEIADCLFGVSMQRDGVSKVISQRVPPAQPAVGASGKDGAG
jgi:chromosome segregation protein